MGRIHTNPLTCPQPQPRINTVMTTEHEFANYLIEVLDWSNNEDGMIKDVDTFESAGLLTNDEGLVIKFQNGKEFQVTIKRSK